MRTKTNYSSNRIHASGKGKLLPAPSTTAIPVPKRKDRNWSQYNKALVNRGNVFDIVLDVKILNNWRTHQDKTGPDPYSDTVINLGFELKNILNLTYRQMQGFLQGLFSKLGVDRKIPHWTTFNKRRTHIKFVKPAVNPGGVLLIDGTGVAYRSAGAWNTIKHNLSVKHNFVRCTITTDSQSGVITSFVCTPDAGEGTGEVSQIEKLLDAQEHGPTHLVGDGAYDNERTYSACEDMGIELVTPPRVNAAYGLHPDRDKALTQVKRIGLKDWKKRRGYHQRSRVEASIGALKTSLGDITTAKSFDGAVADVTARINVYNRWAQQ